MIAALAPRAPEERGGDGLAGLAAAVDAAPDPETALEGIAALRDRLDDVERDAVAAALGDGASLAAVGRRLGLSRQAAHRRHGDLLAAAPAQRRRRREPASAPVTGVTLTDPARLVLRHALAEAQAIGDPVLGGERVLLALLRPPAHPALADAGIALERARTQVLAASAGSRVFARDGDRADARELLRAATAAAVAHGQRGITPEILLLSALADPDAAATRTLRAVGGDPAAVRAALENDADR